MNKPELDIYVWFLQLFDQIMFLFETDIADMKREKHKYLLSTFLTIIVATLMGNQLRQRNEVSRRRERERERESLRNIYMVYVWIIYLHSGHK